MKDRPIWFSGAFFWHSVPTLVRQALGRWYVFRDSPRWFVVAVASLTIILRHTSKDDERGVLEWAQGARDELRLRRRRERDGNAG
jgi:hypothetical protein